MNNQSSIRQCVLIGQCLQSDYNSANIFRKIGTVSVIDHTVAWLQQYSINQIFFFYSSRTKQSVQQYHKKIWSKMSDFKVHLMFMKSQQMKNFGDVMRQVQFNNMISQDFMIMYGDNISNLNLNKAIKAHFHNKTSLKNVVLTTVMQKSTLSSTSAHITNSLTNQLLQIQHQKEYFAINTERINLKKMNVDLRRDLSHCEIYFCTLQVLKSFKETFEYTSMYDFIHSMLTSEVYEEKIIGYVLQPHQMSYRINLAHQYYFAYMHFIANHFYPYSMANRLRGLHASLSQNFVVKNLNKVVFNTAEIMKTTKISNNCMIGKQCKIGQNAIIDKSIIMQGCTILDGVKLKNCIVLEGVTVSKDHQNCLIQLNDNTESIHLFARTLSGNTKKQVLFCTKQLFQQTLQNQLQQTEQLKQHTFQQELSNLIHQDPDPQIMTELFSVQKNANKSISEFTRQIIRMKQPQGVKGVENFVDKWGSILLKFNENEKTLINSLYCACLDIVKYQKAFHIFLQYFYGFKIIARDTILEWYQKQNDRTSDSVTLIKCEPFIDKLRDDDEDDEDGSEDQSQKQGKQRSDQNSDQ